MADQHQQQPCHATTSQAKHAARPQHERSPSRPGPGRSGQPRRSARASPRSATAASRYARQTAERTVDVPVGAALTVADRVTELVEPFTGRQTANRELKSIRTRVERELNKLERRGASARRKTRTRVRQTRNRVERELKQRRRRVETTVKQNRAQAEDGLKRAQTVVQDRVSTLV